MADLEITVSMDAATMVKTLEPILRRAESAVKTGDTFSETVYAKSNDSSASDIIINFDNDDMERAEVAGHIYVEVDQQ